MGSGSFRVLHLTRMQQLAAQAEDELKGINEVTLLPEERSARLEDVLDKYGRYADDPDFATALATSLGQDYFRELPGELGDYQHFWGGGQDGNEDYQLDSRLFAMSAAVLAAATDSEATSHVSADWIADLTHDDRGGVQPGWVVTATDYLRAGVQFPPSYLDAVGQSAIDWERSRPDGSGDPWQGYGNERFNGAEPLSDPPIGRPDPLGAVLDQYSARPDPTSALFTGGPIDPATGRSADPAAGNLMWLLHRSWEGDGADQLGDLLDVMSNPGPNGDPQAAGDVAYNVLTAVALGDDGLGRWLPQGMPSELPGEIRDSVANITARYMGSIIGEAGGQPATGGLFPSGIPGESSVARVDFGQPPDVSMYGDTVPNTSVARALTWLYQDTDNTDVRETLYAGWLTSSGVGAAEGLHEAELANATGDSAAYHREVLELRAHTAASAQVFGLLTQTDVNSFGASDAEAAAKVEEMRVRHEDDRRGRQGDHRRDRLTRQDSLRGHRHLQQHAGRRRDRHPRGHRVRSPQHGQPGLRRRPDAPVERDRDLAVPARSTGDQRAESEHRRRRRPDRHGRHRGSPRCRAVHRARWTPARLRRHLRRRSRFGRADRGVRALVSGNRPVRRHVQPAGLRGRGARWLQRRTRPRAVLNGGTARVGCSCRQLRWAPWPSESPAVGPEQPIPERRPHRPRRPASALSTTVTAPSPIADPRTAQDVATTFLTAYAGGDTRQACRYATSELQSDLRTETGTGCNTVITMERLPEVTLIDSCAVTGSSSITDQVRFHVVPGAGQYPLLVTGEPQDLVVRLRPAAGSFEVTERPTTTDPAVGCAAATS